jgi:hypothetical protein
MAYSLGKADSRFVQEQALRFIDEVVDRLNCPLLFIDGKKRRDIAILEKYFLSVALFFRVWSFPFNETRFKLPEARTSKRFWGWGEPKNWRQIIQARANHRDNHCRLFYRLRAGSRKTNLGFNWHIVLLRSARKLRFR